MSRFIVVDESFLVVLAILAVLPFYLALALQFLALQKHFLEQLVPFKFSWHDKVI
jgi:hypothetical protein